jgi:hypothetical protein
MMTSTLGARSARLDRPIINCAWQRAQALIGPRAFGILARLHAKASDLERRREHAVYFAAAEITAFSLSPGGRSVTGGDVSGNLCFLGLADPIT